jgi:hypothetical protein
MEEMLSSYWKTPGDVPRCSQGLSAQYITGIGDPMGNTQIALEIFLAKSLGSGDTEKCSNKIEDPLGTFPSMSLECFRWQREDDESMKKRCQRTENKVTSSAHCSRCVCMYIRTFLYFSSKAVIVS